MQKDYIGAKPEILSLIEEAIVRNLLPEDLSDIMAKSDGRSATGYHSTAETTCVYEFFWNEESQEFSYVDTINNETRVVPEILYFDGLWKFESREIELFDLILEGREFGVLPSMDNLQYTPCGTVIGCGENDVLCEFWIDENALFMEVSKEGFLGTRMIRTYQMTDVGFNWWHKVVDKDLRRLVKRGQKMGIIPAFKYEDEDSFRIVAVSNGGWDCVFDIDENGFFCDIRVGIFSSIRLQLMTPEGEWMSKDQINAIAPVGFI